MDWSAFGLPYLPDFAFLTLGVVCVYEVLKYKNRNHPQRWSLFTRRDCLRAAHDPEYRDEEIAKADAVLAQYPPANPVKPLTPKQIDNWCVYPGMMLAAIVISIILLYLGLFYIYPRTGTRWHIYAGWILIAATLIMYIMLESTRRSFERGRQLHRKYQLQKAGNLPERMATLQELLNYYPNFSGLWFEMGQEYLAEKKYDQAIEAIKKSSSFDSRDECCHDFMPVKIRLEQGDIAAAEKELAEIVEKDPVWTSPWADVYRGEMALRQGNQEKARELAAKVIRETGVKDERHPNGNEKDEFLANYLAGIAALSGMNGCFRAVLQEIAPERAAEFGKPRVYAPENTPESAGEAAVAGGEKAL